MCFEEVPHDLKWLDVSIERVLVSPVSSAGNHLSPPTAAAPDLTLPAQLAVQAGGVAGADIGAVHGRQEVPEVGHLDRVIIAVSVDHSPVRSRPKVARLVGVVRDEGVLQTVEVDDADRTVRHEIKTSQRRTGHPSHPSQTGSQAGQGSAVDKHPPVRDAGHVDVVGVDTVGGEHLVQHGLSEGQVVMAGGPVTGVLQVGAVLAATGGEAGPAVGEVLRVAGQTQWALSPGHVPAALPAFSLPGNISHSLQADRVKVRVKDSSRSHFLPFHKNFEINPVKTFTWSARYMKGVESVSARRGQG